MFRIGIVCGVLLVAALEWPANRRRNRWRNRRSSAAAISSTPSWPAAIATRRAMPRASRSPTRPFRRRPDVRRRRPSSPPRRTSRPTPKPESEAGAMPRSSARWSRACARIMAASPACRWRRSCRPISTRRCCRTISTPSSPICTPSSRSATKSRSPCTRRRCAAIPIPTPRPDSAQAMSCRSGQARRLSRHHRPLHGMPFRMVARRVGFQNWPRPRRPGFSAARRSAGRTAQHRRQHHLGSDRRHRRLDRSEIGRAITQGSRATAGR